MTRRARGPSGGQWTAQHASPTLVIITLLALWELAASAGWLRPILFPPPSRLALAIWDDYNFDPTFDSDYVKDMDLTTQYLLATGRVKRDESEEERAPHFLRGYGCRRLLRDPGEHCRASAWTGQ